MKEQHSVWVFNDADDEDLREAVELSRRLGELGFPTLPDEQVFEMERELKSRGIMF
jgi:hypothetical protein